MQLMVVVVVQLLQALMRPTNKAVKVATDLHPSHLGDLQLARDKTSQELIGMQAAAGADVLLHAALEVAEVVA